MKLRYNAPVILTFSLVCTAILLLAQIIPGFMNLFIVPGNNTFFNLFSFDILRIISHIFGHANWEHLLGNISFILLIGPVLEEKYGSLRMLVMILFTGLATGIFNLLFLANASLGASGIVFMLILLISVTNVRRGEIPLTLIAIVAIFLFKEIYNMLVVQNDINEAAHLVGGLVGGVFGFVFAQEKKSKSDLSASSSDSTHILS